MNTPDSNECNCAEDYTCPEHRPPRRPNWAKKFVTMAEIDRERELANTAILARQDESLHSVVRMQAGFVAGRHTAAVERMLREYHLARKK